MAESNYAWLSVIVKRGPKTLIPRKVIKMEWEKNFGELLTTVDLALANSMIYQVRISSNESLTLSMRWKYQLHSLFAIFSIVVLFVSTLKM